MVECWLLAKIAKQVFGDYDLLNPLQVVNKLGGRYFLYKKRAEDDLSVLYVRQGLNGKDEVLIDPHTLSPDHTTDIGLIDASSDGKLIIYSVRRGGQDETEMRVLDVDKCKDVDQLPNALYRSVITR